MKTRLLALLVVLAASTAYPMAQLRQWASNELTKPPPVTVTNVAPVPVPEPVPPVVTPTPPTPPPATGPTLVSCKWSKFPEIAIRYSGIDSWKEKQVSDALCVGIIELNGKKVEWFRRGQEKVSLKNAIKDPKYIQNIPKGSVVTINIADVNGKNDSNRMTLVWP